MSSLVEINKLKKTIQALKEKNTELSETLRMIQEGKVDSVMVAGPLGDRIFTLQTSEEPYRKLIETMNEGMITLSSDGIILYCNPQFRLMLNIPNEQVLGSDIRGHVRPENRHTLEFVLERAHVAPTRTELHLCGQDQLAVPVQFSISKIEVAGRDGFCVTVVDLSESKQSATLNHQQEWLGKILNRFPVPLLLLEQDRQGFTFVNEKAKGVFREANGPLKTGEKENMAFSFVNENGEIFKLNDLLDKVEIFGRNEGYETFLLLKNKKIPVLLFTENLPSFHGRRPSKLLIFQDLSALKQAQGDLAQALRGRDQFMAALSHELRTPLNVILGWVNLIRANPGDPNVILQAIDTLERNANLQRDLIEDLLDMSKIITGQLSLQKTPLDLKQILAEVLPDCRMKALEKLIEMRVDMQSVPAVVMADAKRARQLVSHLVHNAIKFTAPHGKIEIRLGIDKESQQAVIEVKDNGQGIDPAFLPHVFEQFKQENMSTSRSYGGLGLGLAICKTIVAQHCGEITAYSEGCEKGSAFTVKLPLVMQKQNSAAATVGHANTHVDLKGLRVLVVDDSKDNLVLFTIWLRNSGAEIMTMESAAGVLEAIRTFNPHVLLSDISMPGEDGYDLIAKVRSMPPQYGGHIPAGALTANARTEDRDLTIAAGYHMHIPKPVTAFSLAKAVKSLSEMAQLH